MADFTLPIDKIYKGHYTIEEKEFICFFTINKENKTQALDFITNDLYDINQFYTIDYELTLSELNYYKKLYDFTKDKSIFIVKSIENCTKNVEFFNLLRFFNLKDYKDIFEKETDQKTLNFVVDKIQKYTQRYIGKESAAIYAEQLKKYNSIFEILTLLPFEILSLNIPFWVFELKTHIQVYIEFYVCSINELKNCNRYNFKIKDVWENKNILQDKIDEIILNDSLRHKENCINLLKNRLNEANQTLLKEKTEAKNTNDEELLQEIEIIQDEFKEIEKYIESENINYEDTPYEWWPSLLYPVVEIYKEDSNLDFQILDDMFSYEISYL